MIEQKNAYKHEELIELNLGYNRLTNNKMDATSGNG